MARFVFGMNQSLDGYVDHDRFAPDATLFRHFVEEARAQAGSIYGRRVYELMHYWDEDRAEWGDAERDFAQAWRRQPKWVVSSTLSTLGPNASLVTGDLETALRRIKREHEGEIEIAGPKLAQHLATLGLIDEYCIYLHPVILGHGTSYFAAERRRLRLASCDRIGDDVLRMAYVPHDDGR